MRAQRAARRPRILVVAALAIAAVAFPLGVLAGHRFADVPIRAHSMTTIEAIAARGHRRVRRRQVLPMDFVTREQMAAFR